MRDFRIQIGENKESFMGFIDRNDQVELGIHSPWRKCVFPCNNNICSVYTTVSHYYKHKFSPLNGN